MEFFLNTSKTYQRLLTEGYVSLRSGRQCSSDHKNSRPSNQNLRDSSRKDGGRINNEDYLKPKKVKENASPSRTQEPQFLFRHLGIHIT